MATGLILMQQQPADTNLDSLVQELKALQQQVQQLQQRVLVPPVVEAPVEDVFKIAFAKAAAHQQELDAEVAAAAKLADLEARITAAETRVTDAETRASEAEARAAHIE